MPDSEVIDGVLVAPKFLAGFERGVPPVPTAGNAFDQARAVIDGGLPALSGARQRRASSGKSCVPQWIYKPRWRWTRARIPSRPLSLKQGVYVPSDGEALTGSGIFVMGNADEVTQSADASGNRQTIRIRQGTQTTVVVIDIDAGTTTVDGGNGTRTLRGIPLDRSLGKTDSRSAASIYVYGDVNALHGPGRDSHGQAIPAIDSNFAVTVTAGGHPSGNPRAPVSGGSVTLTGDLTYETPVADASRESDQPGCERTSWESSHPVETSTFQQTAARPMTSRCMPRSRRSN